MDFQLYFQKVILVGGQFFLHHLGLKKPNTPEYAKVLFITWAKLSSVTALLSPHPTSTAPTGKIRPFSKIAAILEPVMQFGCPLRFRISKKTLYHSVFYG